MSAPAMELLSVVTLIDRAQMYASGVSVALTHYSVPVPVPDEEGLLVALFVCKSMVVQPQQGASIWAPSYVAYVRAKTGRFQRLRAVTAKDFDLPNPGDEPLGNILSPPERMSDTYLTQRGKFHQSYDAILPAFALRQPVETVQSDASDFRQLWTEVAESPLQPYFEALGPEFFAWL